jgi:hypothetical protein
VRRKDERVGAEILNRREIKDGKESVDRREVGGLI